MKDDGTIELTVDSTGLKLKQFAQLHLKTAHGLLKRINFEIDPGDQIIRIVVPGNFDYSHSFKITTKEK